MSLMRNIILLPCTVLALGACDTWTTLTTRGEPAKDRGADFVAFYDCGGTPLSTQYGADGAMRLNIDGRIYPVMNVISASGSKYENVLARPKISFWSKGEEATLEVDGKTYPTCKSLRAAERQDIRNYRAVGNNPPWYMSVTDGKMMFSSRYGEKVVNATLPAPERMTDGLTYKLKTGNRDMTITVTHKSCRDSATGQYYPDTVNVIFYGAALAGCGNSVSAVTGVTAPVKTPQAASPAPATQKAPPQSAALIGKIWVAKTVDGKDTTKGKSPTLHFEEGGLFTGDNGCNRYSGTYTMKDKVLTIGPKVIQTKRACVGDAAKLEKTFTSILLTSSLIELRDGTMIISTPHRKTITFTENTEKKSEAAPSMTQELLTVTDAPAPKPSAPRAFIAGQ